MSKNLKIEIVGIILSKGYVEEVILKLKFEDDEESIYLKNKVLGKFNEWTVISKEDITSLLG